MKQWFGVRKIASAGVVVLLIAGALSASGGASSTRRSQPKAGGSLTMLESGTFGSWPAGLDPATNSSGPADQSYMDAIFGELFELGANGKTIPDLATGYKFTNGGKTVAIYLRSGVKFSDGTRFTASAVAWNLKRDLSGSCSCKPTWAVKSITTRGTTTVVINLDAPDGALINQLQNTPANWMASPTALKKLGAKEFALKPVGAGPFEVVSDTENSKLVLKKNPNYWQAGHPYLNELTFVSTADDESALEAMESGEAQAYEDMTTPQLVSSFKAHFTVTAQPSTSPYAIQLNTTVAPFNNITAREALYYATDPSPIVTKLYGKSYPVVESFTAPDGLFYSPTVPGYRKYNLAKAKSLVKSLGGLNVNLFSDDTPINQAILEVLQSMWRQAGITTTIHLYDLDALVQQFVSKKWQAALSQPGSWDPAGGIGVAFYFSSTSAFSGVDDAHLDSLFAQGQSDANPTNRAIIYNKIGDYLSQKAYAPFLFAGATWNIAAHGVQGPGLTTKLPAMISSPQILWEDVSMSTKS